MTMLESSSKKTTIEEDTDKYNGIYNPNNSITWQSGVREPVAVYKEYLDKSITCTASGATKATLKRRIKNGKP